MREVHLIVEGRVQGVGFRYFTQCTAVENNIAGWVSNLDDGSVEIVAQGQEKDIEGFIEKIKQGPSLFAKVRKANLENKTISSKFSQFEIKH